MSSDWLNLFVHQGREFIDSVSRRAIGKDDASMSDNTPGSPTLLMSTDEAIHDKDTMEIDNMLTNRTENETVTPEDGKKRTGKPVTGAEKGVYEAQLEQLQEQLVDIMIANQEMATELNSLRESDAAKLSKELEKEQSKRRQLEEKLRKIKEEDCSPKLRRRRKRPDKSKPLVDNEPDSEMDTNQTENILTSVDVETISDGDQESQLKTSWVYSWYKSLSERVTLMVWNIISDMTEEETVLDLEDVDGPPLAVKTLKENISRFRSGFRPLTEFFKKVNWVLSWRNPAATMLIFLVYIFSFWHGHAISLVIFLTIVQLSANFVYSKFGSTSVKHDEDQTSVENSASWADRFQVVLHVARKVQNYLGSLSDHLEKIKNLLMWKVPRVTVRLYIVLWTLLIISLALNGPQFFTLLGMFLGYKLFIINPLYRRFPKLKKRHDATLKLWNELPVDSEAVVEGRIHEVEESQVSVQSHSQGQTTMPTEDEMIGLYSKLFCERYKLTSDEIFVKGWEEGWRTSLMNKLKPWTNIKHGRLYLTQNYLCFERSRTNMEKNILLKLSDIRRVNKYKPLYLLPGTGMSIEVFVKDKGDEPYIFGAIYGRDEAYNDILKEGKKAGLSWAT